MRLKRRRRIQGKRSKKLRRQIKLFKRLQKGSGLWDNF